MEKKGDIFNQLAIISDLLEKINLNSKSTSVVIILDEKEFKSMYNEVIKKIKIKSEEPESSFSMKIGDIEFIFNMSNV